MCACVCARARASVLRRTRWCARKRAPTINVRARATRVFRMYEPFVRACVCMCVYVCVRVYVCACACVCACVVRTRARRIR